MRLLYTVNDESEVIPVIPYENGDEIIHTPEHPFCNEEGCPCGGTPTDSTDADDQEEEEQE